MNGRRPAWIAIVASCAALASGLALPAVAQTSSDAKSAAVVVDLKTTLEKGLRCRRPEEFAYIARVLEMVEDDTLPEVLVRTTYGYARNKRPYPFQYFQRLLKLRAKQIGIDVPLVDEAPVRETSGRVSTISTLRGVLPTFRRSRTR